MKVLYRQPDNNVLWGIPYKMKPGQSPRDLLNHPNRGWKALNVKDAMERWGVAVPTHPGEWADLDDWK